MCLLFVCLRVKYWADVAVMHAGTQIKPVNGTVNVRIEHSQLEQAVEVLAFHFEIIYEQFPPAFCWTGWEKKDVKWNECASYLLG